MEQSRPGGTASGGEERAGVGRASCAATPHGRLSRRGALVAILATAGASFAEAGTPRRPPITAAVIAPGANEVVIASQAGIEVLSYPALDAVRRLATKMSNVHDLCFAADDLLVAAGGYPAEGGVLELFDWPGGERRASVELHDDVIYAADCAGGRCLTASADGKAQVFDLAAQRVVATFAGHSRPVLAAALLPGPEIHLAATAGIDETLRLWNTNTGEQVRSLHNHRAAVRALALKPAPASAPGGDAASATAIIASAGADRTVRFWQPVIGRMMRFVELPSNPLALAWSRGGDRLAVTCEDGAVRLLDPVAARITATRPAVTGWAHALCVHPAAPGAPAALVGGPDHQLIRIDLAE